MVNLDDMDLSILHLLKQNSRMTSSDISRNVHLSIPAVAERIKKLEEKGIIDRFTVKLNRKLLGHNCLVYIFVVIDGSVDTESFRNMITTSEYVLECHHLAGEYDYLLKVSVLDIAMLEDFITNTLKKNLGVVKTNTIFILSTQKEP
jgi:Lrp/AsnC family leucine-responsive transcriptional regulator